MKVGVLGSGEVAKVLASGFLKHGHAVTVGSLSPEKLADWAAKTTPAKVGTFAQAAEFGELIVLAVKGTAAADALHLAGARHLTGRTIIDACNPIADVPSVHGVLPFYTSQTDSLMEQFQREFPDAHFVKAFNSVGNARMVTLHYADGKPTMFICGKTVARICDQFDWETADMGAVEAARAIEPLCMLWCIPGFLRNDWKRAFKLLWQ